MSDEHNLLGNFWENQLPKVRPEKTNPNVGEKTPEESRKIAAMSAREPQHIEPVIDFEKNDEEDDEIIITPKAPTVQDFAAKISRGSTEEMGLTLDELLNVLLDNKSSDLHLSAGLKPMMRKHGDLEAMEQFPVLSSTNIKTLMYSIMSEDQQKEYEQSKELDMAHSLPGRSRFRVNVMHQRHSVGSVIRVIPNEIKTLEELGMPDILNEFATLPRGLVLVTGPTGSGKSTTLAAIVDRANRMRHDHIITIEDPIEFVHENKNCIVNQREVGVDTKSFGEALRRALRQDPDIILLGEMRDYETISIAITAAETGHLVFGTLHTQSAAETMSRIIDAFPDGSKNQVQAQLASTLQGIVSQTLVKTLDGKGRVAAVEVLRGEPGVRALIRNGKPEQIRSALETNRSKGMQTLDMHLKDLVLTNQVAVDEAITRASNADAFVASLGGTEQVGTIRRRQNDIGSSGVTRTSGTGLSMGNR